MGMTWEPEKARSYFEKIIKAAPDSEYAKQARTELAKLK